MTTVPPAWLRKALAAAGLGVRVPALQAVGDALKAKPGLTHAEIVAATGLGYNVVHAQLRVLRESGQIASGRRPAQDGKRSQIGFIWIGGVECLADSPADFSLGSRATKKTSRKTRR